MYYEQGNEEQQGDDEVSYLRWTADKMKGDGKLGLTRKRLATDVVKEPRKCVCVANCGAAMKVGN
jgi:hypothetical protein